MEALFASPWGALLIFVARVIDVSIDTMRVIFAIRGRRGIAALLGGIQATIWIIVVSQAVQHVDSIIHILGYSGGYAAGTFAGVTIERLVAYGVAMIRIVSPRGGAEIALALRNRGYGVTEVTGQGREGAVSVLFAAVERSHLDDVMEIAIDIDSSAFITVEEPKILQGGLLRTREWPVFIPRTATDRLRNGG